jgi:hypothetical protein
MGRRVDGRDEVCLAFGFGEVGERAEIEAGERGGVVSALRVNDHSPAGLDELTQVVEGRRPATELEIEDHHVGGAPGLGPDVDQPVTGVDQPDQGVGCGTPRLDTSGHR